MIYGYSNYVNNINSFYKYNYNAMKSSYSTANSAEIGSGSTASKNSYVNSDAIKTLTAIKNNAAAMKDSLDVATQATAFKKMYVESSKAENVAVNSNSSPNSAYKDTQVEVKQVATANVNDGSSLNSGDKFSGKSGTHSFEIEQDGKKYRFSVDAKNGDTNKAVQQRMANAINSRNLGFTASVSDSKNAGTSALSIRSANTGTDAKNDFNVRDLSGGSLVAETGANNRTQTAKNAIFSISGGANRTSQNNDVNLGNGVSVTLKNVSSEAVTISAKKDTRDSVDAVKNLVDSFNNLAGSAKGNSRLTGDLKSAYASYASSLEKIGVTSKTDGTLAIDSEKLGKAAENGSLASFLTNTNGKNFGFTGKLSQIADSAVRGGYGAASASGSNSAQSYQSAQNLSNAYKYSQSNNSNVYNYLFGTSGGSTLGALFNLYA